MPVIAINGADLHYEDVGAGEPVLFLAGPWFDHRLFERSVAALRGFRRLSVDHRGLGRSSAPTSRTVGVDTLSADVLALLDALGLGASHVVGHDLGAEVALRLAANHPSRVRSVVLMAVRPAATDAARRRLRHAARVLQVLGPRALAPLLPARLFGPAARQEGRRRWSSRFAALSAGVGPVLHGMSARGPSPVAGCPALILTGDAQPSVALEAAAALHEVLPDSRLVRIPLAGSAMPVEQPEAVDAAIRAFLARSAVAPRAGSHHPGGADLVV